MSKQDFETIKPQLEALLQEEVKPPKMPVETMLQEAFDLYEWAIDDEQALLTARLDKTLLDELPVRARALRYIQSKWSKVLTGDVEDRRKWKQARDQGMALRKELLHVLRFACRNDDTGVLKSLKEIRKGNSVPDLIQDLSDIAVVGKSHHKALKRVGYDLNKLKEASELCTHMSILLAVANGKDEQEIKYLRDCAYKYLEVAMAEVRIVGRFIFRNDPYRLPGYQHRYYARK